MFYEGPMMKTMGKYISVLLSVLQTVFYDGPMVKTMGNYISVLHLCIRITNGVL